MEHNANQGLQYEQGVWFTARGTLEQPSKPTSSRFDVTKSSDVLFSVLCVSSTWLVQKIACLQTFVFLPSLKLTFVLVFSYWTSIFSMTKMLFHFAEKNSKVLFKLLFCFTQCCRRSYNGVYGTTTGTLSNNI